MAPATARMDSWAAALLLLAALKPRMALHGLPERLLTRDEEYIGRHVDTLMMLVGMPVHLEAALKGALDVSGLTMYCVYYELVLLFRLLPPLDLWCLHVWEGALVIDLSVLVINHFSKN